MPTLREQIGIELVCDDKNFSVNIKQGDQLLQQINRSLVKTAVTAQASESGLARSARSFRKLSVTVAALKFTLMDLTSTFVGLPAKIGETFGKFERLQVMLEGLSKQTGAADRMKEAGDNVKYLVDMAKNAPFTIDSLADAFVKIKTGGIDPLNGSLQSLVDANARFGGDSETLKRAAIAIQQMGGKGVISMEELRQQLGEAVPTAMQYMARALGVSMAKLQKEVSNGAVESKSALERMFAVMQFENEGASKKLMATWGGVVSRLRTSWDLLINDVGKSKFAEEAEKQMKALTSWLDSSEAKQFSADLGNMLATATHDLAVVATVIKDNIGTIKTLLGIYAVTRGASILGTVANSARGVWSGEAAVEAAKRTAAAKKTIWNMSVREYVSARKAEQLAAVKANVEEAATVKARYEQQLAENRSYWNRIAAQEALAQQRLAAQRQLAAQATVAAATPYMVGVGRAERRRQAGNPEPVTPALNPLNAALAGAYGAMASANSKAAVEATEVQVAALTRQKATVQATTEALEKNVEKATLNVETQRKLAVASGLTTARLEAQAVAARALGVAFNLMGGWIGILVTTLMGAIMLWDKFGNAAARNVQKAVDAVRNGVATTQTVKDIQKQLDELDAREAKAKGNIEKIENGPGQGNSRDRAVAKVQIKDQNAILSDIASKRDALLKALPAATLQAKTNDATDAVNRFTETSRDSAEKVTRAAQTEVTALESATEAKLKDVKGAKEREKIISDGQMQINAVMVKANQLNADNAKKDLDAAQAKLATMQMEGAQGETLNAQLGVRNAAQDEYNRRIQTLAQSQRTLNSFEFGPGKTKHKADPIGNVWSRVNALRDQLKEKNDNVFTALMDHNAANIAGTNLEQVTLQVTRLADAMKKAGDSADAVKKSMADMISDAALKDLAKMALEMRDRTRDLNKGFVSERDAARMTYGYEMQQMSAKYQMLMKEAKAHGDTAEKIKQIEADKNAFILARTKQLQREVLTPIQQMGVDWRDQFGNNTQNAMVKWADQGIDAIEQFTETGKADIRGMVVSWLKDLNRMVLQKAFSGSFTDIFSKMGDGVNWLLGKISGKSLLGGDASKGVDAVTGAAASGLGLLGQSSDMANEAMKALATQGVSKSTQEFVQNAIQTQANAGVQALATQGASGSLATFTGAVELATSALANMVASAGGGDVAGILDTLVKGAAGAAGSVKPTGIVPSPATAFPVADYRFARGGIMTEFGAAPLRRYASGGIARSPQIALYGEGSNAEAYVPLPDGRSIPVTMNGAQSGDVVNITINVASDGSSSATQSGADAAQNAWRGVADRVRGIVREELVNQRRTNGLLRN